MTASDSVPRNSKVRKAPLWVEKLYASIADVDEDFEDALEFNNSFTKRAFDFTLSLLALILLSPVFLIIAIVLKLDSKGPAIFVQQRVGQYGKLFNMYKFRSMYTNVDQSLHQEHIAAYKQGALAAQESYKLENDPRITKVGRILRDTSLDELPQLINVVKGEMSLVGPRPIPVYEADLYDLWQTERFSALPGITGLWQVVGRHLVLFEEQLRLDIQYIRHQSLGLNIKIVLATVIAVFYKSG